MIYRIINDVDESRNVPNSNALSLDRTVYLSTFWNSFNSQLMYPNESLMSVCCVCVCRFGISFTYVIENIESKLISECLINDYSLIA